MSSTRAAAGNKGSGESLSLKQPVNLPEVFLISVCCALHLILVPELFTPVRGS